MAAKKILIVEDNQAVGNSMLQYFKLKGFETRIAYSAEDGLKMAKIEKPDIIFHDMSFPGMSGLTAIEILHKDPDTASIPVIVMTATEDVKPAVRDQIQKHTNVKSLLGKPFSLQSVLIALNNALRGSGGK